MHYYKSFISVKATNSKKVLDTKKQICAGYKIGKQKEIFFEWTEGKKKFKKIDPVPYEKETEVRNFHFIS